MITPTELFISPNIKKFKFIQDALKLLESFLDEYKGTNEFKYLDEDYLSSIPPVIDYVDSFLKYYFNGISPERTIPFNKRDGVVQYYKNRLYSVKGDQEVLNVLKEALSITTPVNISFTYEFPRIIDITFDTITGSDPTRFYQTLKLAIEHLLFGELIKVVIELYILRIRERLLRYVTFNEINFNGIIPAYETR